MKVLILFEHANHYHTIDDLGKNLSKHGVLVSSFNLVHWRFKNYTKKKDGIGVKLLNLLMRIPGMKGIFILLFRHHFVLKLSKNYDIIDIHFFSPIYDTILEVLKKRNSTVKITVWGSDFYRVSPERHEEQRRFYQMVDSIQLETNQIANDFLKVYPECQDKIAFAHFGIIQLDIIDELLQKKTPETIRKEMKLPADRTILTCATNGSRGHRHSMMLDSVEQLDTKIKDKLFLIIPMTYGGDKEYISEVRQKAQGIGIPFILLSSFLTLNELCKYRIVSDILLTIQETDALSSATQEHIYTKELFIAGDWLPYEAFRELGIFYLTTSENSIDNAISNAMKNFESLKERCAVNREKITMFSSWEQVINDWLDIYRSLEKQK